MSICDGPPLIHSRTTDRRRAAGGAAALASASIQPEKQTPRAPAAMVLLAAGELVPATLFVVRFCSVIEVLVGVPETM